MSDYVSYLVKDAWLRRYSGLQRVQWTRKNRGTFSAETDQGKEWTIGDCLRHLSDPAIPIRREASRLLAGLRDVHGGVLTSEGAVPKLAFALTDRDATVRANAAHALGTTLSPDAIEPLIGALEDENPQVRMEAAAALGEIGEDEGPSANALLSLLDDPIPEVAETALAAFSPLYKPDHFDSILSIFIDPERSYMQRWHAFNILSERRDTRLFQHTIDVFLDPTSELQHWIAHTVDVWRRWNSVASLLPDFVKALEDNHPVYSGWAADCLASIGHQSALEPIKRALTSEHAAIVRKAIDALQRLGEPRDARAILPYLLHDDQDVRATAVHSLRKVPDRDIYRDMIRILIGVLTHDDRAFRLYAVEALQDLHERQAIPALELISMMDPDESVRKRAGEALKVLTPR